MTNPSRIPSDDRPIQRAILLEFERTAAFDAGQVGVGVLNGVVTLSGVLDTIAQCRSAVRTARRARGVAAVSNDLLIHLSSSGPAHDRAVAAVVTQALRDAEDVSPTSICVASKDGAVVLAGTVPSTAQRTIALAVVERLRDVRSIDNRIRSSDTRRRPGR